MSTCQEGYGKRASVALVLAIGLIALPSMLNAQTATPNAPSMQSNSSYPKYEVFVGYQWLDPGGSVPLQLTPPSAPTAVSMPKLTSGASASFSYNFTKLLGLEGDYGGSWSNGSWHIPPSFRPLFAGAQYSIQTLTFGPKLTYRGGFGGLFRAHAARI